MELLKISDKLFHIKKKNESKTTNHNSKAETISKLKVHSQVLQNFISPEKNYIL